MKTVFYSEFGELDLTNIPFSIQEYNSKVADQLFTKFTLPFEIYSDPEFLKSYGDFVSYENANTLNKIVGKLFIENKTHDAIMNISGEKGKTISAQSDYGFEDLPNFDKKLAELSLENFQVSDIHTFAKEICGKAYPLTNFNFPRMYTEKYKSSDERWKMFDGYINDMKKDGSEMRRNYIDEPTAQIFNVNIIHPCPHVLYLLKTGFADAGFQLDGDILIEPGLQQKWIYSGTDYFTTLGQVKMGILVNSFAYTELDFNFPVKYGTYSESKTIPNPGEYRFLGKFLLVKFSSVPSYFKIFLNNTVIYEKYRTKDGYEEISLDFKFNVNVENSELRFEAYCLYSQTNSVEIIKGEIIGENLVAEQQETNFISNLNEVDLRRAVPDMTFGDFVKIIKNWFNYDLEIMDKTIYMNKNSRYDQNKVIPYQFAEIEEPSRNFLNKKSFLLKFPELEIGPKKNNIYFDVNGVKLNGKENSETSIIEINGYTMQLYLPKPGGYNTTLIAIDSDSVLALAQYSGLKDGQNNGEYSDDCDFPKLFNANWFSWFNQRIRGQEFQWKTDIPIEDMCNVKDYIYCYNNVHIIKSLHKEKIAPHMYSVEFVTETVL